MRGTCEPACADAACPDDGSPACCHSRAQPSAARLHRVGQALLAAALLLPGSKEDEDGRPPRYQGDTAEVCAASQPPLPPTPPRPRLRPPARDPPPRRRQHRLAQFRSQSAPRRYCRHQLPSMTAPVPLTAPPPSAPQVRARWANRFQVRGRATHSHLPGRQAAPATQRTPANGRLSLPPLWPRPAGATGAGGCAGQPHPAGAVGGFHYGELGARPAGQPGPRGACA